MTTPTLTPAAAPLPDALPAHRVQATHPDDVLHGTVHWEPHRSLWFTVMALATLIGAPLTFRWDALLLFVVSTGTVLLLGHSLGMHRLMIHRSYQCPHWLEYLLVWCGTQVGLAGPFGLMRAHELRDYAQRLPRCHDFLTHRRHPLRDAWWQLHCELRLSRPPDIRIDPRIVDDPFYRWLERSWKLQHLLIAGALFAWGGMAYVIWGVCARVTAGVFGHWLIGWFAHNRGGQSQRIDGASVQGHNVRFTSLLTMGECWHNNHHAWPGSARLGVHPGEWDPGWWMLKLLQRLGLVWDLRLPQDLPVRPELQVLPRTAVGPRVAATMQVPWLQGLRQYTGTRTRSLAIAEVIGAAGAACMLALLCMMLLGVLIGALLGVGGSVYTGDVSLLPKLMFGSLWFTVIALLGGFPMAVLIFWPYATLLTALLIKLRLDSRLAFALAGMAPFAWWASKELPLPLALWLACSAACGALYARHLLLRRSLHTRGAIGPRVSVIYDGGSSLCARFARGLPARFLGELEIRDSRADPALRKQLLAAGLNPERGLIVLGEQHSMQGSSAVQWLSKRTAPGALWTLPDLLFASSLVYLLYPLLRGVRRLQLWSQDLPRLDVQHVWS